jgi:hypothetical protein
MSQAVFFRYAFPSLELAVVILAAVGLSDAMRVPVERRRAVAAGLAALALVAAAALGARSLAGQLGPVADERPYYPGSVAWGLGIVVVGILAAALVRRERLRTGVVALVVAADAMLLFAVPQFSAPRRVDLDLAPAHYLQQHLGQGRFFTLGPLQPNYGSYFGVAQLNLNDVPIPAIYKRYVHSALDPFVDPTVFVGTQAGGRSPFAPTPPQSLLARLDAYREAGVTHVLTKPGEPLPERPGGFTRVFRSPSAWIYRLAGASPYFTTGDGRCRVASSDRESARVACPARTELVRRESALPGWRAEVDGHAVPVRTHEGIFQAVDVGPGAHRVEFSFTPKKMGWGYLAFLLGAAWLLIAGVLRRRAG